MPKWTRPSFVHGGADAHVVLVVFTQVKVEGLTVSRSRHGVPDNASDYPIRMDDLARSESPHHFDELEDDTIMALASDEGLDLTALRASSHQVLILLTMPDPEDCEYLRLAWGFARAICDAVPVHGVLDRHARRWWAADRLTQRPPGAALGMDLTREISTLLLTDPDPRFGHVCHTRGLRKFGRPDLLLTGLSVQHGTMAANALHELAQRQAVGERIAPGQHVQAGWFEGTAQAWIPGVNAPRIDLDNAALVLVPTADAARGA